MPETPTFVVNDRRKFTSDGELRHEASSSTAPPEPGERSAEPAQGTTGSASDVRGPQLVNETASSALSPAELADFPESSVLSDAEGAAEKDASPEPEPFPEAFPEPFLDDALAPGPTAEQAAEATRAYDATVERLDLAMRAANPGGDRMPAMSFDRLVQSLYTQALMLLGGAAEPGETPRVDILGARQTIDMLSVIAEKSTGNLSGPDDKLLQSALFDLRMGFLEITQALARQSAQRQGAPGGAPGNPAGPRIVR